MVADSNLILARPKSQSLAWHAAGGGAVRRTFLLLRSRCRMLIEWRYCRPRHTSRPTLQATSWPISIPSTWRTWGGGKGGGEGRGRGGGEGERGRGGGGERGEEGRRGGNLLVTV